MAAESLSSVLTETLALFDQAGRPLTTTEVADTLSIGRQNSTERLGRLVEHDLLETKPVGTDGRVWWRPSSPDQRDTPPEIARVDDQSETPPPGSTGSWFEALFEHSPDMIDVLDPAGRLLDMNQRLCTELGYSKAELRGKGIWEYDQAIEVDGVETLLSELSVGDPHKFEARYLRADGSTFPVEVNLLRLDMPREDRYLAISRDITEQKQHEEALQDRVRQQQVVTDLGERALEGVDLDTLMSEASTVVAETLDNDYCKVLDLDSDAERLLLRQGVGWDDGIVGTASVSAIESESQASYTLQTAQPVVVTDLTTETRFSGPDLLQDHDVKSGISTIIGPLDDPWGILGTHDTERREFSDHDATFVQAVANILTTAITRQKYEEELVAQRERVDALNDLNTGIREITNAVIDHSTREEIESAVCDRLAETDSYQLAWIGAADTNSETVSVRTEAGVAGYTDEITISLDTDDQSSQGPTGTALRTGQPQVVNDIPSNRSHDPWRDSLERYGFQSSAAVPISHESTTYGVLNLYADRVNAFKKQELAVITQLGEVVGHAIAAAERKRALTSTELVELEFRIRNVGEVFGLDTELTGTMTLDDLVPLADDEYLVYGTASETGIESLAALVDVVDHWQSVEFTDDEPPVGFELRLSDPPILSEIAAYGGYIDSARIENNEYRLTIHLAPTADVSQVATLVRAAYPGVEMLRRQQLTKRNDTARQQYRRITDALTDRQSSALETAYHAGYFEWPREHTAEEIAAKLGVSPATFHQHLRKAHKQVFDELLSTSHQRLADLER